MTAEKVRQEFGEISAMGNGHGLKRICYSELDNKQKEAYSYQIVSAMLADYGFACTWLIADWRGADFIAVGVDGTVLKVQLKSGGYEINKKYCAFKDLWMLFPDGEDWYLIKHHDLVEIADETTKHLESDSWKGKEGKYSISSSDPKRPIPSQLKEALKGYKIN